MYIRVRKDGFIYDYNEILAQNPECEVVPEEVAYPERFIPAHVTKRRKVALDLSTSEIPETPPETFTELSNDASRGLP
jgi:hypothetical protein